MINVRRVMLISVCALSAWLAAGVGLWSWYEFQPRPQPRSYRQNFHPGMKVDVPPIDDPVLHYAEEAPIDDEAIVIGVVVEGEARAYLQRAFYNSPSRHIVTDEIESTEVAITYCDRINCTRVLTSPQPENPLDLRVGGWREEDQTMRLIINDQEFSHKSKNLPLTDVPFFELPWGIWRELFPDTMIYLGS